MWRVIYERIRVFLCFDVKGSLKFYEFKNFDLNAYTFLLVEHEVEKCDFRVFASCNLMS